VVSSRCSLEARRAFTEPYSDVCRRQLCSVTVAAYRPHVRLDTARRFALSLPETTEEPHFDMLSFRVKGKIFCTVPPGGKTLHLFAGIDEVRALVDEAPDAFEVIIWGKREVSDWLRVNLPHADAAQVKELLEDAWRAKAPKRVLAAYDAAS